MAVSPAVRQYYAKNIFAKSGRDSVPPNFAPLEGPHTGFSSVEGCRGGGKNVLEVALVGEGDAVKDVRMSCGLCNPAMYVSADVVAEWGRGRSFDEILAIDPFDVAQLDPLFAVLGGPTKPDDAREKFQYALIGLQNAVRNHRGEAAPELLEIEAPTDKDWA